MPTNVSQSFTDYDGELATVSFQVAPVAGDGSNYAAVETSSSAIGVAITAMQRGAAIRRQNSIVTRLQPPGFKPNVPEAQREEKWLVTYYDTQEWLNPPTNDIPNPNFNRVYNLEIPCANLSYREGNSEFVADGGASIVAATEVQDFIDAFNTNAVSPSGTSVAVLSIRSVGRNS